MALAESFWLSLPGEVVLDLLLCLAEVDDSVHRRPFASLFASTCGWSADGEEVLDWREGGNELGSSTNAGGRCRVEKQEAVARRMSFWVCARWSMNLRCSLSALRVVVVLVR